MDGSGMSNLWQVWDFCAALELLSLQFVLFSRIAGNKNSLKSKNILLHLIIFIYIYALKTALVIFTPSSTLEQNRRKWKKNLKFKDILLYLIIFFYIYPVLKTGWVIFTPIGTFQQNCWKWKRKSKKNLYFTLSHNFLLYLSRT